MDISGENQTRTFAEGILKWNADSSSFNEEKMTPVHTEKIIIKWLESIENYLV